MWCQEKADGSRNLWGKGQETIWGWTLTHKAYVMANLDGLEGWNLQSPSHIYLDSDVPTLSACSVSAAEALHWLLLGSCNDNIQLPYLCVSRPHMNLFFGKVTFFRWHRRPQVNANILRYVKVGPALIVIHFFNYNKRSKESHK